MIQFWKKSYSHSLNIFTPFILGNQKIIRIVLLLLQSLRMMFIVVISGPGKLKNHSFFPELYHFTLKFAYIYI